jgi:glycosyltransferase involved in cell wall biosynthesis
MNLIESYQKVQVEEFPNEVLNKEALVSICVQTYQQVDFIRECLDSILMQETNIAFEILLGEDDSADGTREICLEYAKKHPDKIRLFLHTRKNNIKIKGKPTGRFNFMYNLSNARGKYIAFCEGDDYWIDKFKLQKQVDFLSSNSDHSMVFSAFNRFYEQKGVFQKVSFENQKHLFAGNIFNSLIFNNWISTISVMVKKDLLFQFTNYVEYTNKEFPMADYPAWLDLSYNTKIGLINDSMAVHRVLPNSASHSTIAKNRVEFGEATYRIQKYFIEKYKVSAEIENQIKLKINKKRIRYAFFLNDKSLSNKAKKEIIELGCNLSFAEKIYYYSLKNKIIQVLLKKIFISFGVWI